MSYDSFLGTHCYRPLARKVAPFFARLNVSPNQVTALSLAMGGVASTLLVTRTSAWAPVLLWQVALVLDFVDGEVARMTRRTSVFGAWLDAVGDRLKELMIIAAATYYAFAVHRDPAVWVVCAVALSTVALSNITALINPIHGRQWADLPNPSGVRYNYLIFSEDAITLLISAGLLVDRVALFLGVLSALCTVNWVVKAALSFKQSTR